MKAKWTGIILLALMLVLCSMGEALAAAEYVDGQFDIHLGAGDTILPDYPDFSSRAGSGVTKEDFHITYHTYSGNLSVDEEGRITASGDSWPSYGDAWSSYGTVVVQYTPKGTGKGKEVHFRCRVQIYAPMTEFQPEIPSVKNGMEIALDQKLDLRIYQPYESYYSAALKSYDSNIVSATLTQKSDYWMLSLKPLKIGETTIVMEAYNGVTLSIPFKVGMPPSKFTLAQEEFICYVGDMVDLGMDLGGGVFFGAPDVSLRTSGYYTGKYGNYFGNNYRSFYAKSAAAYEVTMTLYNGLSASFKVKVYDRAECESIKFSQEVLNANNSYKFSAYDEEGNVIYCPIEITKGADKAYIVDRTPGYTRNRLYTTAPGLVELTATNPDGSKKVFEVEICEKPTKIILNETQVTLDIGERFELEVSFDKGNAVYSLNHNDYSGVTHEFYLSTLRMEGNTFIAQRPGQWHVSVYTPSVSGVQPAECIITVKDSDKDVRLIYPEMPLGVGRSFQMKVVDKTGKEYPAVFTTDNPSEYVVSLEEDGFVTGLTCGSTWLNAALEDGRCLRKMLQVDYVPAWVKKYAIVCSETDTEVDLGYVATDVGVIPPDYFEVSIADESIATYSSAGQYFKPKKAGETLVTLTAVYGGAQGTFTLTVLKSGIDHYLGSTSADVPVGYYTTLPETIEISGREMSLNWEITYQSVNNAFALEGNEISCLLPDSSCEVTGKTSSGYWTRVVIRGYRLAESIQFKQNLFHMELWQQLYLEFVPLEEGYEAGELFWYEVGEKNVSFSTVKKIYQRPKVYAYRKGATMVAVELINGAYDLCLFMVSGEQPLHLPDALREIGAEAFAGTTYTDAYCPSKLTSIGEKAFENCTAMEWIFLPPSVKSIAENAFDGCDQLTICCQEGSYAQIYAYEHGIPFLCY